MKIGPEELDQIAESTRSKMLLRAGNERVKVVVHMGSCGIASGAKKILKALQDAKDKAKAEDLIISTSGCAGLCSQEPMITVYQKALCPVKYTNLNEKKVNTIFHEHILMGKIVKELVFSQGNERVL
ncbi:MAG: (2Fe-2S) ferredoxin domain-containing protein [Spirochaetales bacterium]|nr:(2Fe-2S) ferredoxin domain-containing protein [Spirochaetales bacterium]